MRFSLLGPLAVVTSGGDAVPGVDLGPPKQRAVLALLLLNRGRVVSVDRIVDAVWGETQPPNTAASLHAYISKLRRLLREGVAGPDGVSALRRHTYGYVLDMVAERVDLAIHDDLVRKARLALEQQRWGDASNHAEQALALWRGELLEDFQDEDWVQNEARALNESRAECREILVTAQIAFGRLGSAMEELHRLRDDHPLRERGCWLQAFVQHRAGRTAEALDTLRRHARLLDEELGLEPGRELVDLQTAILRQDPQLISWPGPAQPTAGQLADGKESIPPVVSDVPAATPTTPIPAGHPEPSEPGRRDDRLLVGRVQELETLRQALAAVRAGTTCWVVLSGPAGIGKTRLAEECGRLAGVTADREVWLRCPEGDGVPAWWPIRQLVSRLGGDPDALLAPPEHVDSDEARYFLYDRVRQLVEDVAENGPLLLAVDDVQWSDPTSLRCLAYLAGAMRNSAVGVVLTIRDGHPVDAGLRLLRSAVARADGHRQIAVPPLGAAEVRELARAVSGRSLDAAFTEELTRRTGGNPLFVSEYARLPEEEQVRQEIPVAVRSVLARRLSAVAPEVLDILRAAAVLGDVVEIDMVAATAGVDVDTVADIVDAAADQHVLTAIPGTTAYGFAHGLLRDQVLAEIPPARRRRLHARAAAAAGSRGDVSRRAGHLLAALPLAAPAEVLDACVAAARQASDQWSSETAAQWYGASLRAYDLLPATDRNPQRGYDRDDLVVARVDALARSGRGQTVLDAVESGLLDAVRTGRSSAAGRLAAALLRAAGAWPYVAYGVAPGPVLERLAVVEPLVAHDPAAHARVLAALAVGSCYDPNPAVPEEMSRHALRMAEDLGDPEVIADAILGRAYTYVGVSSHSHEAIELLARLDRLPHQQAQLDGVLAHAMLTMAAFNLGDIPAAERHVRLAIAGSDLLRLPVIRVQMRWMTGALAQWRGQLDLADREYATAAQIHLDTELHDAGTTAIARHTLLWEQGRLAALTEPPVVEPLAWGAAIANAQGNAATAEQLVRRWLAAPAPEVWTTLGHCTLVAHVVADLGLVDVAGAVLARLADHLDRVAVIGVVGSVGPVAWAAARLHLVLGETADAVDLLERARSLGDRTGGRSGRTEMDAELVRLTCETA